MNGYKKIIEYLELHRFMLLVFFSSLFILISFSGTRLFISDEGVILDQFYNLIQGSLAIKIAKIDTLRGMFILVGDNLYGKFSYSLLFLSLPTYYFLKIVDSIYGAHLFMLQLWAISGGIAVYLIGKVRNFKLSEIAGILSYLVLITVNLNFFKPISFPKWGELLSIEFTNIFITAFIIVVVYLFFRDLFGNKIALFSSFFILLATPIPFYATTLKHHSLTVLLTLLTFYFSYMHYEKKDNRFIYYAYIAAGLCVWTRILEGSVLLVSLMITDILFFRRDIKYIFRIIVIILVSLLPFFGFNYLILGDPFTFIDSLPATDREVTLYTSDNFISLGESKDINEQVELMKDLGYRWQQNIRGDLLEITGYVLFFRLINTFGIFLVSPFLIAAFAFFAERYFKKIKLTFIDKLFILYSIMLIILSSNYVITIVRDTPAVLEYRYLLTLYISFLYFILRIDKIRVLITEKSKTICTLYCFILMIILIYFVMLFPVAFLDIYYKAALITSIFLIIILLISIYVSGKRNISFLDNSITAVIALSLALSTSFLVFYYWIVSMTYVSISQNFTIVPIPGIIIGWMYQFI